jgi:hypothetical protein
MDALAAAGLYNTIIVMDTAKYHKCIPDTTPKFSWSKADLMNVCDALGLHYEPGDLKASIWSKLSPYVATIVADVVDIAATTGHKVVYSTPNHSSLSSSCGQF